MIRGVIFDMDGVLVDSEPFYHARRLEYLRELRQAVPPALDLTGSNERAIWEALVPDDEARREELKLGYRAYTERHPAPFRDLLDPSVGPVFRELKRLGHKLAIASSSDMQCIGRVIDAAGIREEVDFYLSGEECQAHKPNPEVYERSLQGLGLTADEAIAVEDSSTGIAAAKNAGLVVYALRPAGPEQRVDQSRADGWLGSLPDILQVVSKDGAVEG